MNLFTKFSLSAAAILALVGAAGSDASATTLEVGGVAKNSSVSFTASLDSGSASVITDEFGTTTDLCSFSEIRFTSWIYSGTVGGGANLWFFGCSQTTKVLKSGQLSIGWSSGTNGSVSSSGAEITVFSPFFGVSAVCKTGEGTTLGTLTGVNSGHAKMDIKARINCGVLGVATWTGVYTVTSPTGLGVVS
jgi:hypothetical protein